MTNKLKKLLFVSSLIILIPAAIVLFIIAEKFEDTAKSKPHYIVNAIDLIKEYQQNDSLANKKYIEKIVAVNGIISEVEPADTTVNIRFTDSLSGDYIIFAFQQQHLSDAKKLKVGEQVSIKGSCSGGNYSEILGTRYISFKRAVLNK